jgi:ABC-type polar amino acid transport system ATPase subunit
LLALNTPKGIDLLRRLHNLDGLVPAHDQDYDPVRDALDLLETKQSISMITLRNLRKIYPPDSLALDDCSVTIAPGEFVVFIGPSGLGKSTLLRCINHLISPTSGQVIVDAMDVAAATRERLRQVRRSVGMVFQQLNLIKRASVMDNVLAGRLVPCQCERDG